ncbi:hypothetical protein [Planctomyces sp. SH-PL62]|uniref:hypothetical protein n=1 Tax=Planctomyces sp. SH-PL62 TaxID=1636152 RepID=UPI00078D42F8|nr:hypothetical protein [Planctomyces sp. SH-PL62]AMV38649.1 hypothetical protein VT85_14520 [Planctomyces sp. SH-PL62]
MTSDQPEARPPRWCLAGNIVEERRYGPLGAETRRGTRLFAPGAKVYCLPFEYDRLFAFGRHRKSGRFIGSIVPARLVVERRAQLVYHPEVLRRIEERMAAGEHGVNSRYPWDDRESVESHIAALDALDSASAGLVDPLPVEIYDELVASGTIASGAPFELLNGVLVWKPPKEPRRSTCAERAHAEIERIVPEGFHLR